MSWRRRRPTVKVVTATQGLAQAEAGRWAEAVGSAQTAVWPMGIKTVVKLSEYNLPKKSAMPGGSRENQSSLRAFGPFGGKFEAL